MSRADVSDPAIAEAINTVKNTSNAWVMLEYVAKSDSKFKVGGQGTGGFSELYEYFNDGRVQFVLWAAEINNTRKFVYISWCGEGVTGMKKGIFGNHSHDIATLFKGFHIQVDARSEDDVKEADIMAKLKKASGASYDSGAKIQGSQKHVPTNVAQGKVQATQSNVKAKSLDKSDYNKKDESANFWQGNQAESTAVKKTVQNPDYNQTAARDQFWKNQQTAPAPAPVNKPAVSTGALKNNQFNAKPTPAPAPAPSLPKKTTPPPPPVKQPEPEPEPEPEPAPEEAPVEPEPAPEAPVENYDQGYDQAQDQGYDQGGYEQPQDQGYEQPQDQGYEQGSYDNQDQGGYEQPQDGGYEQGSYDNQPASNGVQCKAVYDFQAENPTDLSFPEGAIITVHDKSDPSGWWEGEYNGVRGYFPSNFVEEI